MCPAQKHLALRVREYLGEGFVDMTGRTLSLKFECLMTGVWTSCGDMRHVAESGLRCQ